MSPCDFNRRQFLSTPAPPAAATIAATLVDAGRGPGRERDAAAARHADLFIVTLYGGNDGLNTVVPYWIRPYLSNRPTCPLTRPSDSPSDSLALNGTMTGFASLWTATSWRSCSHELSNPNLSHFSSMAIWQSGSADRGDSSGWIGRYLDSLPRDPFRAIGVGSTLTPPLGRRPPGRFNGAISGLQVPTVHWTTNWNCSPSPPLRTPS